MKNDLNRISCEAAREMMFDYIDGALNIADVHLLEAHISECDACRHELAERREMLTLVKESRFAVPSSLRDGVMEKIKNTPQDAKILTPKRRFMAWSGTVAAACAVIMVLVAGRAYIFSGMDLGGVKEAGEALYTADMNFAAEQKNAVDADGADPLYTAKYYATGQGKVDNQDSEPRYVETTIAALDALSPTASGETKAESSCASAPTDKYDEPSEFDAMFDKVNGHDTAVIICREGDIDDAFLTAEPETLILGEQTYLRYVAVSYAEPVLDALIDDLESSGADYRAFVPENAKGPYVEVLLLKSEN